MDICFSDINLNDLSWEVLPEGLSGKELRLYVESLHFPHLKKMTRGRLYSVSRTDPSENSYARRLKTPPYMRPVAGGGYKLR
jgi:hypothetical protein